MTLPFGKFKGQPLQAVPSEYLQWLLKQSRLDNDTRQAVHADLDRRSRIEHAAASPILTEDEQRLATKGWKRSLRRQMVKVVGCDYHEAGLVLLSGQLQRGPRGAGFHVCSPPSTLTGLGTGCENSRRLH
jgi:hypothetical protein